MQLIRNKINGEIVYRSESHVDLFTVYNLNLKRNFPNIMIDDYEILDVSDKNQIKKINESAKVKCINGVFEYTPIIQEIEYQIDKVAQLQCQILMMQKKIDDLTEKINASTII